MKNIFKLFSALMVMIGSFAFGQYQNLPAGATQQDAIKAKELIIKATDDFVESISPNYRAGMSLSDFERATYVTGKTSKEGKELIDKAYDYLSGRAVKDSSYGKEMAAVYALTERVKYDNPRGADLTYAVFGIDNSTQSLLTARVAEGGCKWHQIGCLFNQVVAWIEAHPQTTNWFILIMNSTLGTTIPLYPVKAP